MAEKNDAFYEDLLNNAEMVSAKFKELDGEEAGALAKTLDMQAKTIIAYQQHEDEREINRDRLNLEREKFKAEMELKKYVEDEKLKIERSKANAEKATLWAKVATELLGLGSTITMGVLYLKANMKYGGMLGKDAQNWFKDLKHFKL